MALVDIVELNQLTYRYADAIDACEVDQFIALFTHEARMHIYHPEADTPFAELTGHEQLQIIPGRMRNMFAQTMHVMTNQLVDVDGDRATGTL